MEAVYRLPALSQQATLCSWHRNHCIHKFYPPSSGRGVFYFDGSIVSRLVLECLIVNHQLSGGVSPQPTSFQNTFQSSESNSRKQPTLFSLWTVADVAAPMYILWFIVWDLERLISSFYWIHLSYTPSSYSSPNSGQANHGRTAMDIAIRFKHS